MTWIDEPENIFSSVPADHQVNDDVIKDVRDFFYSCIGCWNTAPKIAAATGLPTKDTCVKVRKAITVLVERDEEPIVSGHAGYTMVRNDGIGRNMLRHYVESLEDRQKGIARRINALQRIIATMENKTL